MIDMHALQEEIAFFSGTFCNQLARVFFGEGGPWGGVIYWKANPDVE